MSSDHAWDGIGDSGGDSGGAGLIADGVLGTPLVTGAPTSYTATLNNGAYAIEAQASGITFTVVEVPIAGALAANGVKCRLDAGLWGNTGLVIGGVYAKSTLGKFTVIQLYNSTACQWARYNAGWAGGVTVLNQLATWSGSPYVGLKKDGANLLIQQSGDGVTFRTFGTEAVAAHLVDIAEYGLLFSVPTGIWGAVRFGDAGPQ